MITIRINHKGGQKNFHLENLQKLNNLNINVFETFEEIILAQVHISKDRKKKNDKFEENHSQNESDSSNQQ